uniref:Uncharacterized protein n=1 Tax=Acrobeloides nanus TaxID=290746 RepID=A0A914CGV8_9BILA
MVLDYQIINDNPLIPKLKLIQDLLDSKRYDPRNCTIILGSWTSDSSSLDYFAEEDVNLQSYISNEEWSIVSFKIYRHEYLYPCCPKPWVILEASLVIRRKPLFYIFTLIIPTSIITIVAIVGFFTPASTGDERTEKFNLGMTTLLAMSILLLMVAEKMPTTSEAVPLIGDFIVLFSYTLSFQSQIRIYVNDEN